MNGSPLERSPADRSRTSENWRGPLDGLFVVVGDVEAGGRPEGRPIELVDPPAIGAAQPDGVLHQRIEDGIEVEGGAADRLQHLTGGGLLLQGRSLSLESSSEFRLELRDPRVAI